MHTVKLRQVQEPSSVKRLLESFVSRTHFFADGSHQVSDPRELPPNVRAILSRASAQGQAWSCWARGSQIWLFTGEMSLPLSRERGTPVLLVRRYGEDAELQDSGAWRYDALGAWGRFDA